MRWVLTEHRGHGESMRVVATFNSAITAQQSLPGERWWLAENGRDWRNTEPYADDDPPSGMYYAIELR